MIITSCETNENINVTLFRKWKWIYTSQGSRRPLLLPRDEYSTYYIEFKENGKYIVYDSVKNKIGDGLFELLESPNDGKYFKLINDSIEVIHLYNIRNNTLMISLAYKVDPSTHIYINIE